MKLGAQVRDAVHRARERICEICGHTVLTAEMTNDMLSHLVGEVDRLSQVARLQDQFQSQLGSTLNAAFVSLPKTLFALKVLSEVTGNDLDWKRVSRLTLDQRIAVVQSIQESVNMLSKAEQNSLQRVLGDGFVDHTPTFARAIRKLKHPSRNKNLREIRSWLWSNG